MKEKINLLYVEDNDFDKFSFRKIIDTYPEFVYDIASNIKEAREKLSSGKYQVVVSDFSLPDGNAFEILAMKMETPVIIITGTGGEETAANLIKRGAKDYLIKDFNNNHFKILPVVIEKVIEAAEAERAQATLAALVESAGDAILTIDVDSRIMSWNNGAQEIYGYDKESVIGKRFFFLCNDENENEFLAQLGKLKKNQGTLFREMKHRKKDGETITVYLSVSPVWNKSGNINCFSVISKDITEVKRKENELLRTQMEIQKSKELEIKKDQFIGIASHELKTPLTSVKAYIDLLERQAIQAGEENTSLIPYISKSKIFIKKLEMLINDLLDVSKIQMGKLNIKFSEFDVDEWIADAVDSIQKLSEKHVIKVTGKVNSTIEADKERLEEVICNYLTNAVKYSPENFTVEVSPKIENGQLVVCVEDHGIGISRKDIPRLFERYFRVEDSSYKFTGLGIGLFISKEIINKHQGKVWVESEPGIGSKFYFSVPVKQMPHRPE